MHLRPAQIHGRLLMLLRSAPPLDLRPPPPVRARSNTWTEPIERSPGLIEPWRFRFLNLELEAAASWDDPTWPRLWRYHLHYHDDLSRRGGTGSAEWQKALIRRWMDANPGPTGTGWEPYPLSLRLVNWIKWLCAGHDPVPGMLHSMAIQARRLACRPEVHLLGNHLFENAKALVFAGAFFGSNEGDSWLRQGLQLVHEQAAEQVLPDGGHFELSPMYHARILEGVLDLINLAQAFADIDALNHGGSRGWIETAKQMFRWLDAMSHPDGEIALFNDSALNTAASRNELAGYASRLGMTVPPPPGAGLVRLSSSGYYRAQVENAVAIFDAAPLGPDYLPAHGHADTLTFELSLGRQRLIVDTGVSTYETGPQRAQERGTAAHNTITIDGHDSSEVWASFRVGRRASVFDVRASEDLRAIEVAAAHDGYRWLRGRPLHRRKWRLARSGMDIEDTISGSGTHQATARFHFHPALQLLQVDCHTFAASDADGNLVTRITTDPSAQSTVMTGSYHPEFGTRLDNAVLECRWQGELPCRLQTIVDWSGSSAK